MLTMTRWVWEHVLTSFDAKKKGKFLPGRTQQFVCPNMVSDRKVAATRKILFEASFFSIPLPVSITWKIICELTNRKGFIMQKNTL